MSARDSFTIDQGSLPTSLYVDVAAFDAAIGNGVFEEEAYQVGSQAIFQSETSNNTVSDYISIPPFYLSSSPLTSTLSESHQRAYDSATDIPDDFRVLTLDHDLSADYRTQRRTRGRSSYSWECGECSKLYLYHKCAHKHYLQNHGEPVNLIKRYNVPKQSEHQVPLVLTQDINDITNNASGHDQAATHIHNAQSAGDSEGGIDSMNASQNYQQQSDALQWEFKTDSIEALLATAPNVAMLRDQCILGQIPATMPPRGSFEETDETLTWHPDLERFYECADGMWES